MSSFELVSHMNAAFGNSKGSSTEIDQEKLFNQCLNIQDEIGELFIALGCSPSLVKLGVSVFKSLAQDAYLPGHRGPSNLTEIRDALCDIHVFAYGAHHFMGINADEDMVAVVDGVMTRFIKDEADKVATIALHAAKGVTDVYFEGEFPTMVMKSASAQVDAPQGKFLKSASFVNTQFKKV